VFPLPARSLPRAGIAAAFNPPMHHESASSMGRMTIPGAQKRAFGAKIATFFNFGLY
jgi:hypothetical protein